MKERADFDKHLEFMNFQKFALNSFGKEFSETIETNY